MMIVLLSTTSNKIRNIQTNHGNEENSFTLDFILEKRWSKEIANDNIMCQQYHKNVCLIYIFVVCKLRYDYSGKRRISMMLTEVGKLSRIRSLFHCLWVSHITPRDIPTGRLECFTLVRPSLCKDANSETYSVL